ncbi:MAG: HDOD domain-containing protein [Acidimicrobiales bacterium]
MTTGTGLIDRSAIFQAAERIEPLPASISRLLSVVADPDYSHRDILEVIRFDPALTADLLRRANSAIYSGRAAVTRIADAISRLGMSTVISVAVARVMQDRMAVSLPAYGLGANDLWNHSMAATVAAEAIRRQSGAPLPPQAGTAALLHDVGKLIVADCLSPSIIEAVASAATTEGLPLHEAERTVLGVDHAEVGGVAVRTWGLPVSVQVAVTRHHDLSGVDDVLAHLVAAADMIADAIESLEELPEPDELDVVVDDPERLATSLDRVGLGGGDLDGLLLDSAEQLITTRSHYRT